jgi:hypothetical protein
MSEIRNDPKNEQPPITVMAVISPKRNRKIRRYHCKELYKILQE